MPVLSNDGDALSVSSVSDPRTATVNPDGTVSYAKNTKYKALVTTGARDLTGNRLAANKAWYFTVKP